MSFDVEKYKDEVSSEDNRHYCKVTLQNGRNEKNLTENPDEHSDDTTDRTSTEMVVKCRRSLHEWLVYGSVFIVMMAVLSIVHTIGMLFPFFLDEFGESRAKTAAIQSVFFGVGLCSGLFTGLIVQHYGPRRCGIIGAILFSGGLIASAFASSTTYLIITIGILTGLGGPGFLYLSACQAASLCFEGKSKLIGMSIATSSIGVGAMIYPYLIKVTVDSVGLKGTLLILGGITMNAIPLAVLWSDPKYRRVTRNLDIQIGPDSKTSLMINEPGTEKPAQDQQYRSEDDDNLECHTLLSSNQTEKRSENQHNQHTNGTVRSNTKPTVEIDSTSIISKFVTTVTYKPFSALILTFACAIPSVNMFEILLLDVLETSGLSRDRGIILLVVLNAVSIPARMFPGLINKIPRCKSVMSLMVGSVTSVAAVILLRFTRGFTANVISCVLLGTSKGILLGCLSVVTLEMLGTERLSTGMGIEAFVNGILTTAQGPLHGFIRDVSGSYTITLYMAAASMMLALLFSYIAMLLENRAKARKLPSIPKLTQG